MNTPGQTSPLPAEPAGTPDPVPDPAGTADPAEVVYAGFWIRVGAALIDLVLLTSVTTPLIGLLYGWDFENQVGTGFRPTEFLITWVLPAILVLLFWRLWGATPGKLIFGAKIVDAASGGRPGTARLIGRYAGYFVSAIPFSLGFLWVGFDRRKQGWHDKLARTVVIRRKRGRADPVRFGGP